jgi:ligand-binding sensor domain-containing protein
MPLLTLSSNLRTALLWPLLAVPLLMPTVAVQALQGGEWSAYTSMAYVHDLLPHDGAVWAVTGGGVLRYDTITRTYQRFTRLDGLVGNLVTSIAADSVGHMWFGTDHQGLSRYRPQTGSFDPPFLEFEDLRIQSLLATGNRLFVGTDIGVSAFLLDKEEVKETYRQLAGLPKDTGVRALALFDGRLWAGTDQGIASADLRSPNLQDPDNWKFTFTGAVRRFLVHSDTLFCATKYGVGSIGKTTHRAGIDFSGHAMNAITEYSGTLYSVADDGSVWVRQGKRQWTQEKRIRGLVHATAGQDSVLWLATPQGLRVLGDDQPPPVREPAANYFYEMTMADDGDLWVASVPKDNIPPQGVYQFDGTDWRVHDKTTGLPSDFANEVASDAAGRIWVGTWGKGVAVLDTDASWSVLNEKNSALQGCCGNDSFVAISDVKADAQGYMWLANVRVGLVVMDGFPPRRDLLYEQETIGLGAERDMGEFAIGPDGLKWIATSHDGLVLFDDGGTPFEPGDEYSESFNTLTESRLSSDRTSTVVVDRSGRIWVGTDNGLNQITGTYSRATHTMQIDNWRVYNAATGLPASAITSLAEDNRGNMWVGTHSGLAQIDGASGIVDFVLNTRNSGLIDNRVNSLLFDASAGELWIGTLNGLSRLRVDRGTDADNATASVFPNPLLLQDSSRPLLTLTGLPLGAAVEIFTVGGGLVRHIPGTPGQGTVIWDALNDGGYRVSSGVYLYLARDEAGNTVRGKFAAVNAR